MDLNLLPFGVGSDCFVNCATSTTTTQNVINVLYLFQLTFNERKHKVIMFWIDCMIKKSILLLQLKDVYPFQSLTCDILGNNGVTIVSVMET